jgi:DNA-directed RNA polymerase subunit RPC12/RpoP
MAERTILMELVAEPEPGTATVIVSRTTPALRGNGSTDYVCGACQAVIGASLRPGEIDGVIFRCPACGRVNRAR